MAARAPSAARLQRQSDILLEAERQFARFGFEGVAIDAIASALGLSRQNLLYYYPTKEELYVAVLDNVLTAWLGHMDDMAREDEPRAAISHYVRAKLRFSQERPLGSAVFTREVMSGAPLFGAQLTAAVIPRLRTDVKTFERWARQGRVARVNFTHLMFIIWSATQAYADLAPQFALLIGKPRLGAREFDAAHALITEMVMGVLGAGVPAPVSPAQTERTRRRRPSGSGA